MTVKSYHFLYNSRVFSLQELFVEMKFSRVSRNLSTLIGGILLLLILISVPAKNLLFLVRDHSGKIYLQERKIERKRKKDFYKSKEEERRIFPIDSCIIRLRKIKNFLLEIFNCGDLEFSLIFVKANQSRL